MTYTPHSLLDAAKLTADIAGVEWATAHRYYRDLQGGSRSEVETSWLPKSLGRNIWTAHPNYLASLIVGLAMADSSDRACAAVTAAYQFTPNGRDRYMVETIDHHVRDTLARLLGDPEAADALERIEFDPVEQQVEFRFREGTTKLFAAPGSDGQTGINGTIYRRGVVPGTVIAAVARTINWRVDSPLSKVPDGTVDEEA